MLFFLIISPEYSFKKAYSCPPCWAHKFPPRSLKHCKINKSRATNKDLHNCLSNCTLLTLGIDRTHDLQLKYWLLAFDLKGDSVKFYNTEAYICCELARRRQYTLLTRIPTNYLYLAKWKSMTKINSNMCHEEQYVIAKQIQTISVRDK